MAYTAESNRSDVQTELSWCNFNLNQDTASANRRVAIDTV